MTISHVQTKLQRKPRLKVLKHLIEMGRQLMVSEEEDLNISMRRAQPCVGVDSSRAQGKEGVWGLPGQVLDTAALLTEGQLSAHVCRAHIKQHTQFCASA